MGGEIELHDCCVCWVTDLPRPDKRPSHPLDGSITNKKQKDILIESNNLNHQFISPWYQMSGGEPPPMIRCSRDPSLPRSLEQSHSDLHKLRDQKSKAH